MDETGFCEWLIQVIVVHPNMDVVKMRLKWLLKKLQRWKLSQLCLLQMINHQFLGVVPPLKKNYWKLKRHCLVTELIQESTPCHWLKDPITQSISATNNYTIYEMPVLNGKMHELVGIWSLLDDALDIYQEEAKKIFEKLTPLDTDEEHHF